MIFYFSATGNTRWAAYKIQHATKERLVYIPDAIRKQDFSYTLLPDERIGFVFPVHGWRPPKLVRNFIGKLHINSNSKKKPYCYALITAGDDTGYTIDYLNNDMSANLSLRDAGISQVDSAFSLIMPESYVGLPFMDTDNQQNEKEKKQKSSTRLQCDLEKIFNREENVFDLDLGRWPWINSHIIGSIFVNHLITDAPFHVSADRCVKCGICSNTCPVDNIKGGHGLMPEWKHTGDCLTCFNCYHHCPKHAIEYGKRTKNKGQYFYK